MNGRLSFCSSVNRRCDRDKSRTVWISSVLASCVLWFWIRRCVRFVLRQAFGFRLQFGTLQNIASLGKIAFEIQVQKTVNLFFRELLLSSIAASSCFIFARSDSFE